MLIYDWRGFLKISAQPVSLILVRSKFVDILSCLSTAFKLSYSVSVILKHKLELRLLVDWNLRYDYENITWIHSQSVFRKCVIHMRLRVIQYIWQCEYIMTVCTWIYMFIDHDSHRQYVNYEHCEFL